MTDEAKDQLSDQIVADRIRFACNSLGISDADSDDMAQRAIAARSRSKAKRGADD